MNLGMKFHYKKKKKEEEEEEEEEGINGSKPT
jgi:hypothetical protein